LKLVFNLYLYTSAKSCFLLLILVCFNNTNRAWETHQNVTVESRTRLSATYLLYALSYRELRINCLTAPPIFFKWLEKLELNQIYCFVMLLILLALLSILFCFIFIFILFICYILIQFSLCYHIIFSLMHITTNHMINKNRI